MASKAAPTTETRTVPVGLRFTPSLKDALVGQLHRARTRGAHGSQATGWQKAQDKELIMLDTTAVTTAICGHDPQRHH
jgi:hypothetical protein